MVDCAEHGPGNNGAGGGSIDERRLVGCNACVAVVFVAVVGNTCQRFQSSSSPKLFHSVFKDSIPESKIINSCLKNIDGGLSCVKFNFGILKV